MTSKNLWFDLQLAALWLTVSALAIITSFALISSVTRSDCLPPDTSLNATSASNLTVGVHACTLPEMISASVYEHVSILQSVHITLVQCITALSLLIFRPSLRAMAWSALEHRPVSKISRVPVVTINALQHSIDLAGSPGILPAVLYAKASKSVTLQVLFVLVVSIFSFCSPIVLSPIYQAHKGPYSVQANLVIGGGVRDDITTSFSPRNPVAEGVAAGRALINTGTTLKVPLPLTFNASATPFIPTDSVQSIWKAQVQTVVAYNSLDCGSSAPMRLSNTVEDFLTLDPKYFDNEERIGLLALFAGRSVGDISNDPQITVAYLNASASVSPGSVQAQTSIVFLAGNGTLEGAQLIIPSPTTPSRISSIDVLVCTSTTTLVISDCTIDKGSVTSCEAVQPQYLPQQGTSSLGALENYISLPKKVAIILAASPVTAFYNLAGRLPMYNPIDQTLISNKLPPLSYLSLNTTGSYSVPFDYITDVLFGQTARGLVQGMVTVLRVYSNQQVQLISTFGTSEPILLCVILFIAISCSLTATFASTLPRSAREAEELDLARLLAISRNPQLDPVFKEYSERTVEIDKGIQDVPVGYQYVSSLSRRALVLDPGIKSLSEGEASGETILMGSIRHSHNATGDGTFHSTDTEIEVPGNPVGYSYLHGQEQPYVAIVDLEADLETRPVMVDNDFDPESLYLSPA